MKVYKTSFRKKIGEIREMFFVEIKDLPSEEIVLKGNGEKKILPEGMKLVWDVEKWNFRILNENQLLEDIKVKGEFTLEEIKRKFKK